MQLNKIDANNSCQPLKQSVAAVPLREIAFKNAPVALQPKQNNNNANDSKLEAKYDLACRLAAFYKKQYENLKSQGSCCI